MVCNNDMPVEYDDYDDHDGGVGFSVSKQSLERAAMRAARTWWEVARNSTTIVDEITRQTELEDTELLIRTLVVDQMPAVIMAAIDAVIRAADD